jgi:hypothetical protein
MASEVHKYSTIIYFINGIFGRSILCMAEKKAGYRRGQKYIRNLRLYEVTKNGRAYWRLRTPEPSGTGFSERDSNRSPDAARCARHQREAAIQIQHDVHDRSPCWPRTRLSI